MANFNKVLLIGNLTRDPEIKYLPSGTPVVEFGLASNRRWKDRESGEQREQTTFVDCKTMGRSAEVFKEYMSKGRSVFIEGRLDFRSWETPDGGKRSKLEVYVENFQFLGAAREGGGAPRGQPYRGQAAGAGGGAPEGQSAPEFEAPGTAQGPPPAQGDVDDVPF